MSREETMGDEERKRACTISVMMVADDVPDDAKEANISIVALIMLHLIFFWLECSSKRLSSITKYLVSLGTTSLPLTDSCILRDEASATSVRALVTGFWKSTQQRATHIITDAAFPPFLGHLGSRRIVGVRYLAEHRQHLQVVAIVSVPS